MNEGTTHWEWCWQDPKHHECALAEIDRLREVLEKVKADLENEPYTQQYGYLRKALKTVNAALRREQ